MIEVLQELIYLLEEREEEKLRIIKNRGSNNYYIQCANGGLYPNIVFRVDNYNNFILSNIFIKNKGRGTGKLVLKYLIKCSIRNRCNKFIVRIVKNKNLRMIKILNDYNMRKISTDEEFSDYILDLEENND